MTSNVKEKTFSYKSHRTLPAWLAKPVQIALVYIQVIGKDDAVHEQDQGE